MGPYPAVGGHFVKRLFMMSIIALWFTGCSYFRDPFPQLQETQAQLVTSCMLVGTITENADADWISAYAAEKRMIYRIKERSVEQGDRKSVV